MKLAVMTALAATACVGLQPPPTPLESRRDPTYERTAKRILVFSPIRSEFSEDAGPAFNERLTRLAAACHAEIRIDELGPMRLKTDTERIRMTEFGPDAILSFELLSVTSGLVRKEMVYRVRLRDVESEKAVWVAIIRVPIVSFWRWGAGEAEFLATAIAQRLSGDHILGSCGPAAPAQAAR